MDIRTLFDEVIARQATDLHLVAGQQPTFRCDGALTRSEAPEVSDSDIEMGALALFSEEQQAQLLGGQDVNAPVHHAERLFQVYAFRAEGSLALAIRLIPNHVPLLEELRLTEGVVTTLNAMIRKPTGLILVTGQTGSGKQTLCASMLESVNREIGARIWTLEDPLVYEMTSRQSLITQRAIGRDAISYEAGLRSAIHADVDIVYIGDLRSLEAAQLALILAETGHTVLAVMGVGNVSEAVQRLCDVFGAQGDTIRRLLAQTLIGVVAQRLLKRGGGGRVAIQEILLNTPRVRQVIRDGQTDLTLAMEAGRAEGMQTMDDALLAAYAAGHINSETAWEQISDPDRMKRLIAPMPQI
jgi:twitching motility protein PilT